MSVRAKFRCDSITLMMGYRYDKDAKTNVPVPSRSISMSPVYGNGNPEHENTKFWEASPSGKLDLNVVNAAAADMFEVGKEYYLDISPAPAA
jgi:hypothetical protein